MTVSCVSSVLVPASTECVIQCSINEDVNDTNEYIFSPLSEKLAKKGVLAASSLCRIQQRLLPIRIINTLPEEVSLYKGTIVGNIEQHVINEDGNALQISTKENYEHLEAMIVKVESDLKSSYRQKTEITQLIKKYGELFTRSDNDIGYYDAIKHEIKITETAPCNQLYRRVPMGLEDEVDKEIEKLLDAGIVRHSNSKWASPIVVIRKKNESLRICVDFRKLNAVTIKPVYYIPETNHLLDCLSEAKWFTSIDLSSAYHQLEIEEKDKHLTSFITRKGQFEYNRMPFGLCGAPFTFQRTMNNILRSNNWIHCLIYLDDVLIFSSSFDEST